MKDADEKRVQQLKAELSISEITARLLVCRGLDSVERAQQFLNIDSIPVHDPFLLKDMDRAVRRIQTAIEQKETILIFGDYDADGVTSTALLVHTLKRLQANVLTYIPNRLAEGYGPNEAAFRWAKQQGVRLIISVDTGISAVYEAEVAKELNLDFIITDHHEPPPKLPNAHAIINPKQPDCSYPFKELAGVGVAFKLAHALLGDAPKDLLDFVAIGTVADLVPLKGENRKFVSEGIPSIENSDKPGIQALLASCGVQGKRLNEEHLGFMLGPRLNAAGRIDSADSALQLLMAANEDEAKEWSEKLEEQNKERQKIVDAIAKQAIAMIEEKYMHDRVFVIAQEGWHSGVVGIVASRLVERYYRPVVIFAVDSGENEAKGSARSIANFNIFANLSLCKDLLVNFGGHPMAAGLTIKIEDIEALRERLNALADEQLAENDFIPITDIDVECEIEEITVEMLEELERLAPFGVGNPKPKFLLKKKQLTHIRKIGIQENHLKFQLKEGAHVLDGVGFRLGYLFHEISQDAIVNAVGELSINEWNGFRKPQLMLTDVSVEDWQLFDCRGVKQIHGHLQRLPYDKVQLIHFRSQTLEALELLDWKHAAYCPANQSGHFEWERPYHVILDLPKHEKELIDWYRSLPMPPKRMYAFFYHEEDHLFTPVPSREQFKFVYAFLRKVRNTSVNKMDELAQTYRMGREAVHFIIQVFVELNFVKIEDGMISIIDNPVKRVLTDSETYQRKLAMIEMEKKLLYSPYNELKAFFQNIFARAQVEEATN